MAIGIGIDLGGTEIKIAAFLVSNGEVLARRTAPTRDGETIDGLPAFVAIVQKIVTEIEAGLGEASHVGVSAPGLADRAGSAIELMPCRLAGLEGLVWGEVLGRAVPVLNDASAALLGERWKGAAQGIDDVVMLTLGTGVGGAVVTGGKLLRGVRGRGGHLGHTTVDSDGAPGICGTPGSLEDAIGNATLSARAEGRFANTHELVAAYAEGDAFATEVWMRSLRALAGALASFINVLDPSAVVIGGGIAEAGDSLFGPLEILLREREWQPAGARVELLPAELGSWAGTYGAVHNAISKS